MMAEYSLTDFRDFIRLNAASLAFTRASPGSGPVSVD
jgi:hypothetical protein